MELILAIDERHEPYLRTYLLNLSLAEKYARLGYTIYIEHSDGSLEKYMDPIIEVE